MRGGFVLQRCFQGSGDSLRVLRQGRLKATLSYEYDERRIGDIALDDSGDGPRTVSRRQERCFMLKRAFRVDESALDDPGDGQRTVPRRRERCFMLDNFA